MYVIISLAVLFFSFGKIAMFLSHHPEYAYANGKRV
jgi:hypothetical protein